MLSENIKHTQLTLDFEPGLLDRYRSLRDCIAAGVYRRGLSNTAIDLNKAPGNLSVELSDETTRNFSVDSFETFIEKSRDFTPIYYLIEKFLSDRTASKDAARDEAIEALKNLAPLLKKAGIV